MFGCGVFRGVISSSLGSSAMVSWVNWGVTLWFSANSACDASTSAKSSYTFELDRDRPALLLAVVKETSGFLRSRGGKSSSTSPPSSTILSVHQFTVSLFRRH